MDKINKILKYVTSSDNTFGILLFKDAVFGVDGIQNKQIVYKRRQKHLLVPGSIVIQADPFLFVWNKMIYLFYESLPSGGKGYISMVKSRDLTHWSEPMTVLHEPFHLSFPYVFEHDGDVFMIPETQEVDEIRLYKANRQLTDFQYVRTLLRQNRSHGLMINYSDSHLLHKDGLYYLFTSVQRNWNYELELYYTDDLFNGTFMRHPKSPVCIDNKYGRCGGSIITTPSGELLRVTQDCSSFYGRNVSLMRILSITAEDYQEKLFQDDIFPIGRQFLFPDGAHQLNITVFQGQYVYATDFKERRWNWYMRYLSIKNRLFK